MSTLYLTCGICGRKQADGILSRRAWGHLDSGYGAQQACPTCKAGNHDWEAQLTAGAVVAATSVTQGATLRAAQ
jgi:hypothetical protein